MLIILRNLAAPVCPFTPSGVPKGQRERENKATSFYRPAGPVLSEFEQVKRLSGRVFDGEDFAETPAKGWYRLAPRAEVRLKGAYFVTVKDVVKDASGQVIELKCTYDPATRGGESPDGRKVKGTIQWVSADHGLAFETRLYDTLLAVDSLADVPEDEDWRNYLNPQSLVVTKAIGEPTLKDAKPGVAYQFMRKGYFCLDSKDSTAGAPVFNRTVTLKDTWTKQNK